MTSEPHIPVLMQEALDALALKPGGRYLDGTFGAGGYSRALLEREPKATLLALDRDDLVIGATRAARRHLGLDEAQIGRLPANDLFDLGRKADLGALDEAQRAEMARALARSGGNVSAAARDLGIGRATFYRKAKALGLTG